jgi:hypothetical protein
MATSQQDCEQAVESTPPEQNEDELWANYSVFHRWEQRCKHWKDDCKTLQAWIAREPVSSVPPIVSFLKTGVCEDPKCTQTLCVSQHKYAKALEELEASLEVTQSDPKEESLRDGEQATSAIDGLVESESMQHFDEDAIKRQHAAISRYQAVTSKRHRELTRIEKEQTAMFDLVFTAHDFSSLGMTVPSAFSNINYSFQHLISLRSQPSLTQVSSKHSEDPFGGRIDMSEYPYTGSSGWCIAKNPSTLCFDDIGNPTETSSIKSNASVQASSQIGNGRETLLQFQTFLQDLFNNASEVNPSDDCFCDMIHQTCLIILAWSPSQSFDESKELKSKSFIPCPEVKETKGCRMINSAIMLKIAYLLGNEQQIQWEKTNAHVDLLTLPINAVVSLVAQHLSESLAYICFAPINVKPEKIVKGTSKTVPAKDVQLVLGHLANHLLELWRYWRQLQVSRCCRDAGLSRDSGT